MAVGLGSTWAEIIKAINNGGGSGIPKLTTQTVAIANLDAGVYLWDYNGEKTLDYYSGTKQIYKNPIFLQISSNGDTQKDFYLFDNGFGADDNQAEIIWGSVESSMSEGWCWSKFLKDIPTPDEDGNIYFDGNNINLYATQNGGNVEILVGQDDNTTFYISEHGVEVSANTGFVHFSASDNIGFYATSGNVDFYADNSMSFSAEYGDIVFESSCYFEGITTFENDVNFDAKVVFSTAPKIGESEVATKDFVTTEINEILGEIENGSY